MIGVEPHLINIRWVSEFLFWPGMLLAVSHRNCYVHTCFILALLVWLPGLDYILKILLCFRLNLEILTWCGTKIEDLKRMSISLGHVNNSLYSKIFQKHYGVLNPNIQTLKGNAFLGLCLSRSQCEIICLFLFLFHGQTLQHIFYL